MRMAVTHGAPSTGAVLVLLVAGLWFFGWGLALAGDVRGLARRLRVLASESPRVLGAFLAVIGAGATAAAVWLLVR